MTAEVPSTAVVLTPYDPSWPVMFSLLRDVFARALGDVALAIEHVGSTSIPGLLAKPVIDIDIVMASADHLAHTVRALAVLGYRHNGCQDIPGREVFKRDQQADVPRDGSGRHWPAHNLYVCARDADELRRHIVFRDWLRAHPAAAAEYGVLKLHLAELHGHDRDIYSEAKTEFVEAIIAKADASCAPVGRLNTEKGPARDG
ncbi:MAG: GrpB family protein [Deltaproteobacteria bacterium]|nr:GrpB family protein [Nannocystaceae bacterium]